jgi:hypothetical protein
MQATSITANLSVPDVGEARDFYVDYLGLNVEGFNMGSVANTYLADRISEHKRSPSAIESDMPVIAVPSRP